MSQSVNILLLFNASQVGSSPPPIGDYFWISDQNINIVSDTGANIVFSNS